MTLSKQERQKETAPAEGPGARIKSKGTGSGRLKKERRKKTEGKIYIMVLNYCEGFFLRTLFSDPRIQGSENQVQGSENKVRKNKIKFRGPKMKFVKKYADVKKIISFGAKKFKKEVKSKKYPSQKHSY